MKDTILFGDCRETLKEFDEKARCCVTSPPYYGLRDYGGEDKQIGLEQTPEEYIEEIKRERFNWYTLDVSICIKSRWMVFKARYYLE